MVSKDIVFNREQHLGLIKLNRPQALNALNLEMIKALQQQLAEWQKDESIHAVILQAEEGKAFCAGGDVLWLYEAGLANDPMQMQFFWHEFRLNHFIHHFTKPYIALMDGITMGGGVGISLHGSHPVATERFSFAMPETGIGFFPDIGACYFLARCPGQMGLYLGLTGSRMSAQDAALMGLVKKVIPSERLSLVLEDLLVRDLSRNAHQQVDECLAHFALAPQIAPIEKDITLINQCFSADSVEEIFAALEKKDDEQATAILKNLEQKAPLSLKVTWQQIKKAKTRSLADCLKMDYCLVNHFMKGADFYEGIRALLIDKDKTPQWNPASLSLATEAMVASYFKES